MIKRIVLCCMFFIFGQSNIGFAQKIEVKNLVPNANFEEMGVGWNAQTLDEAKQVKVETGVWATDEIHSGKYSLQIINNDPNLTAQWVSDFFSCEGNIQYSFWLKTFSLKNCGGFFNVRLDVYDKDKNRLKVQGKYPGYDIMSNKDKAELLEAVKTDWVEYKTEIALPSEIKYGRIIFQMIRFTGVAWIDDVKIIKLLSK